MEIISELTSIPNLSLALGFFDGVHLGHQSVIGCAVDMAHSIRCRSAVLTFEKHPECYLNNLPVKNLTSTEDKHKYIEQLGVDYLIYLNFDEICKLTPMQYLDEVIFKYFSPKAISTGFNHHFGIGRSGGVNFLANCQSRYGYSYAATPPQTIFGEVISSSSIRYYLKTGAIPIANSMLGRSFSIAGNVIEGKKIGRTIGFPTANIVYPNDIIQIPYGVYDVNVILDDGTLHKGIANYGSSPTVEDGLLPKLETYILDFDGNLYGKNIRIEFLKMIRKEVKFDNLEELKTQIEIDIQSL